VGTFLIENGPIWRRWLLAGGIIVIPLTVVRPLNDAINVPKLALLMMLVAIVLSIRLVELAQGVPRSSLVLAVRPALYLVVPVIVSWLFSPFKAWGLYGEYARFQGLIPYLLVALFGVLVADAFAGAPRVLAWALSIVGAFVGGLGLLQVWNLDPFPGYTLSPVPGAVGTMGNPNFAGGFLAVLLPISIGLWILDPLRRRWSGACFALMAGGIGASASQGPWVAGLVGVTVAGALLFKGRGRKGGPLGLALAGLISAAAVGAALAPLAVDRLDTFVPQTVQLRGMWWVSAIEMGLDSPLVGHGPNAFGYKGVQYRTPEEAVLSGFEFPDDPHSVPMATFANLGLLGLLGLGATAWWAVSSYRRSEKDALTSVFLAALGGAFAQSLVSIDELSLRIATWAVLGGLAAAMHESTSEDARKRAKRKATIKQPKPVVLRHSWVIGVAALMTAGTAAYAFSFMAADRAVLLGRGLFASGFVDDAREEFESALSFRDEYEYRHLYGFELGRKAPSNEGFLELMGSQFKFTASFPDLPTIRDEGIIYRAASEIDPGYAHEAAAAYLRALQLDDLNPALRSEAFGVLLEAAEYQTIIEYTSEIPTQVMRAADLGARALAMAHLGQDQGAGRYAQEALELDPADAWALAALEILKAQ
jgi:tetratricopeptide (TPR) repeat protein